VEGLEFASRLLGVGRANGGRKGHGVGRERRVAAPAALAARSPTSESSTTTHLPDSPSRSNPTEPHTVR